MKGQLTDPGTWSAAIGDLIERVGWSEFMNLIFIAILAYIAYTVPTSVNQLTKATQQATDRNEAAAAQYETGQRIISESLKEMSVQHIQISDSQKKTSDVLDTVVDKLVSNRIVTPRADSYDAQDRHDLWKRIEDLQKRNGALEKQIQKQEAK